MSIFATLKMTLEMRDGNTNPPKKVQVPAGRHELERIPNPCGFEGNWLVLKGTKTGMAEPAWKQWINGKLANNPEHPDYGKPIDWGEFEIVLEEDGVLVPPPAD